MFNKYFTADNPAVKKAFSAIQKALGVSDGGALIAENLETAITNTIHVISPELSLLDQRKISGDRHDFNRVTALGQPGGAMGDTAVTPTRKSTIERAYVDLKVVRRKGAVTNFLKDAAEANYDAFVVEMENSLRAHIYDIMTYLIWGNADANQYEFTGIDNFISTNRISNYNGSGVAQKPTDLTFLDKMIDRNTRAGGARHKKMFMVSPEMASLINQLQDQTRINIDASPLQKVEIDGGWIVTSYRGIPIVESTHLSGAGSATMGAVTATSGGTTGGTFSDGTYYFRVTKVTVDGESLASAEANVTLSGGTATQYINLAFTADTDAYLYRVYYGTSTGVTNTTIIHEVSANIYDSDGTITSARASIDILSGSRVTNGTVPAGRDGEIPPTAVTGVNPERIYLWDLDPIQGLGKFPFTHTAGNRVDGLVSIKPLAETDDFLPFLTKTYAALADSFEKTSVVSYGLLGQ